MGKWWQDEAGGDFSTAPVSCLSSWSLVVESCIRLCCIKKKKKKHKCSVFPGKIISLVVSHNISHIGYGFVVWITLYYIGKHFKSLKHFPQKKHLGKTDGNLAIFSYLG